MKKKLFLLLACSIISASGVYATALHDAIKEDKPEKLPDLIKSGDVNAKDSEGLAPLHLASMEKKEMVDALLAKDGVIVDIKNNNDETPLYVACFFDQKDIADALLAKGAKPNAENKNGYTPLFAAVTGSPELVELLISKGADPKHAAKKTKRTPLHWAAGKEGNEKIIKILIDKGADPNAKAVRDMTPLHVAARQGNKKSAEALINNGAHIDEPDMNGMTPLHMAARLGKKNVVYLLLAKGANPHAENENGVKPIHYAKDDAIKEALQKAMGIEKPAEAKAQPKTQAAAG